MTEDIKFRFTTETGGNPKQIFTMLQKGFRDVAKGLQETAKQLLDLQKTDAAEAIGHVSLSINKFASSLTGIPEKAKKVTNELKLLNKTEKEMAQSSKLAQQAWAMLKKQIDDGSISIKGARSHAMQYQKAWDKLVADVRVAGGTIKSINKDIDVTGIAAKQSEGHLKLVGGAFKALTAEGYKYLITNDKVRDSVRQLHQSTSLYHTTVRELSKITFNAESYVKAAEASKKLAQAIGHSEAKFKNIAPVIKNTEVNLTKYGTAQKALLGTTASWVKEVDRVAVVNQNLANTQAGVVKHIDVTTRGIKILSMQGMKPFAGLTLETAQKLGMLDSSMDKFVQSMNTVRQVTGKSREEILRMAQSFLTSTGSFQQAAKAVEDYIKKTIGIQKIEKEIKLLTTRYSELTSATDRHGVQARKLLDVLSREPGQLSLIRLELSKLNAERNKEILEARKAESEYVKLSAQYRNLLASQSSYGTEARKTIETLKLTGTSIEKVRADLSRFNAQLKDQAAITTLTKKYSELMASTDRYGKNAQRLVNLLRQKPEYMNRISIALSKLNSARNAEIVATKRAREAHETLSVTYRRLLNSQTKWGVSAREVIATLNQKGVSVNKVKAQLNALHGEMNSLNNVTNRLAKSFRTYGSYMISSSVMMGVIRAFRGAAAAIRDYSQGLQDIQAITKATSIEMMRMDKALLDVVKNTKFSVDETAKAMKTLGQAGFSAKQVIEGIPNVANLATGTLESLDSAVDLVSTAVYTFRMGMDQTAKVADMFANAVTNSRLTVSKLNIAMNYIGPLAKAAGISLQETNAAMMLLANSGLRASTIGTGFRRVLTLLLKPTTAFRNAVIEAGYSMDDFNPLLNDFSSIIEKLPKVVQNSQHAVEMFGVRGSSVITAFTTQGAEEFERLKATLEITGTASWMAAVQMEGLGLQVKNLRDRLGALAVAIGKAGVEDFMKTIVNAARSLILTLTELTESSFGKFIISLGTMAVASGALYASLGMLSRGFSFLRTQILLTNAAAMTFLSTPIGWALAGITAASLALAYAWQSYKSSLEETMVENANMSASLQTVSEKIIKYNRALNENGRDSKEAKEAALDLKETIQKSGESSEKVRSILKKYGDQINENTGYIENNRKFVRDLSNELRDELEDAYWRVAKAAEASSVLMEDSQNGMERWIPGWKSISKLLNQLAFEIDFFYNKLANSYVGGVLVDSFNWAGKKLTELAISFNKFSNMIGLGGPTGVSKSFDELKKSAESGSKEAERALVTITAAAKVTADSLLEGKDASALNKEEIVKLATEWENLNKATPAAVGAVIEALETQREKAINLQEAYKNVGNSIASAYMVGQEELRKFNVSDEESLRKRAEMTDKHIELIRKAADVELQKKLENQIKELVNFKGTEEEKAELVASQKAAMLELNKQHLDAEKTLLESQKQHTFKFYQDQIATTEQYYEAKKDLLDQSQEKEIESLEEQLRRENIAIAERYLDEEKLRNESVHASMKYHKEKLDVALKHFKELDNLNKESIQGRITAEQALAESTQESQQKIKEKTEELNRELLDKQKENLRSRREAYASTIDEMRKLEEELTKSIQSEIQKRQDFHKSVEDILRELQYKTLSEEQVRQSEITRAQKLESEARQHIISGEFELAKKKASEAISVYNSVGNSLKAQGEDTAEYVREISNVSDKIKDVSGIWDEASRNIQYNMEQNKQGAKDFADELQEGMNGLDIKIKKLTEDIQSFGLEKVDIDVSLALNSLSRLDEALKKVLDRKRELGLSTKEVTEHINPDDYDDIPGHAVGARIPGYGGGDVVDARLEPGEWVIRKEAVQKYGDSYMNALNNMRLEKPRFKTGGPVSETQKRVNEMLRQLEELEWKQRREKSSSMSSPLSSAPPSAPLLSLSETGSSIEQKKEIQDFAQDATEKLSRISKSEIHGSDDNFYSVPDWESLVGPYRQSNDAKDLYKAINTVANLLDADLTNIGMAVGTGVAGAGLLAKSGIVSPPKNITQGYYLAEGAEQPNKNELTRLMHFANKSLMTGAITGSRSQQAYDYLKRLFEMWNTQMDLPKTDLLTVTKAKAGGMGRAPKEKEFTEEIGTGSFFTGHIAGKDLYDEKGRVLDWEELRKKAIGYQTGGRVLGSNIPSASSIAQKGAKQVSQPIGPSHTVHFKLGGEVHGPFQSDGPTVEGFIETLRIHQMRS